MLQTRKLRHPRTDWPHGQWMVELRRGGFSSLWVQALGLPKNGLSNYQKPLQVSTAEGINNTEVVTWVMEELRSQTEEGEVTQR